MVKQLIKGIVLAVVFAFVAAASACEGSSDDFLVETKFVFGGKEQAISIDYALLGSNSRQAADEMVRLLGEYNAAMDPSLESSDIYKFNALKAGERIAVNKLTYEAIALADVLYGKTGGYFNPAVFPLVELWRLRAPYTNFMENVHPASEILPAYGKVLEVLEYCKFENIGYFAEGGQFFLQKHGNDGVKVELGALLKGMAADICRDVLTQYEIVSGQIDISGNIYIYRGFGNEQADWRVNVRNPNAGIYDISNKNFVTVLAQNTSFVASGDYHKFYSAVYDEDNLVKCAHIINPFTGLPMNVAYNAESGRYYNTPGLTGTTVMGASSAYCDAFTTATILMPIADAAAFISAQNGYSGIFISDIDTKQYATTGQFRVAADGAKLYAGYNAVAGGFANG